MEKYTSVLIETRLFRGMDENQAARLLSCIGAVAVRRDTGKNFLMQGSMSENIFIVVEGTAIGERVFADGRTVTVSEFFCGDVFGDVLSGSTVPSLVNVRAATDCTVVSFALEDIIVPCDGSREQQKMLLLNLIGVISDKYFGLNARLSILLCGSLRAKIALFIIGQAGHDTDSFYISKSREEMARYLCCDRSALSRELSRMCKEGIISVQRRKFTVINRKKLNKIAE